MIVDKIGSFQILGVQKNFDKKHADLKEPLLHQFFCYFKS